MEGGSGRRPIRVIFTPSRKRGTGSRAPDVSAIQPVLRFEARSLRNEVVEHTRIRMTEDRQWYRVKHNITPHSLLTLDTEIDKAFSAIAEPVLNQADPDDLIGVQVVHADLPLGPVFLAFNRVSTFRTDAFTTRIMEITQSNSSFLFEGSFQISISVLRRTAAGRYIRNTLNSSATTYESRKNSKSLLQVVSRDNECGHKAIYLCSFRISHFYDPKLWKRITQQRFSNRAGSLEHRTREMIQFVNRKGGSHLKYNEAVDEHALSVYAKVLGLTIVVYRLMEGDDTPSAKLHFLSSPRLTPDRHVFLELMQLDNGTRHYNVITRIAGYLKSECYCFNCYSAVSRNHRCNIGCASCESPDICHSEVVLTCPECGRKCSGSDCLDRHKGSKLCVRRWVCPVCAVEVARSESKSHVCLSYHCKKCDVTYKATPHYCSMPPLKLRKQSNVIICAYDIECMFSKEGDQESHLPILLTSMTVCDHCYIRENIRKKYDDGIFLPLKIGSCSTCLDFLHVFRGEDCVNKFNDYILKTLSPHAAKLKLRPVIRVFAHNAKSYDARFILRDIFHRNLRDVKVIMQGTKILCIDIANVRYQDSLNLFMCQLKKLPDTYNFKERIRKGDFPFYFNTKPNQGYKGPVPDLSYFGYDYLKPDDRVVMKEFHDSISKRTDYDLQEEMEQYCHADVEILLIAVQEFRESFRSIAKFDSIQDYFTLPSMAFATFRSQYLQPKTLAITPNQGYSCNRNSSMIASAYLDWKEYKDGVTILREQRIGVMFADGFDHESKTIYEVNGCAWHGCPSCYPSNRSCINPLTGRSHDATYSSVHDKQSYYANLRSSFPDMQFNEIWECEIRVQMGFDNEMNEFMRERITYYRTLKKVGGCDLRESYFGGRTENIQFLKICEPDEWFEIVDFCSLYPSVLDKFDYMIGHPQVIRQGFEKYTIGLPTYPHQTQIFGFVKCLVLPPKQMRFPILPVRNNERLEFNLCKKCGDEESIGFCTHRDSDRCLIGTFATPELELALKNGYRIQQIYEILHWNRKSDELFHGFISQWIKIKTEASGFPPNVITESDKDAYIADYQRLTSRCGREGIILEKEKIRKDPVARTLAKLMMNSFYGKLAQRQNMETTEIITDHANMWSKATDEKRVVTGMVTVEKDKLLLNWKFKNEDDARQGIVNLAVASFITSYARRELWLKLNEIESRSPNCVYYFDTDSIFYLADKNIELLATGPLLGDLTDEVPHGKRVVGMVILGPKNYAYILRDLETKEESIIIKVKGITLDACALKTINIDSMKRMCRAFVEDGETIECRVKQRRIHSAPDQRISNRSMHKVYRVVSRKRLNVGNNTYPRGFVL